MNNLYYTKATQRQKLHIYAIKMNLKNTAKKKITSIIVFIKTFKTKEF